MRQAYNILISSILLVIILFKLIGLSVERCSCTGETRLVVVVEKGCCESEKDCMTLKTMQVSDYIPTDDIHLNLPFLPLLFPLFHHNSFDVCPVTVLHHEQSYAGMPGGMPPETVTVLRV